MTKHGCYWILGAVGSNWKCRRSVRYTMVPGGWELNAPLVRKYELFCADHTLRYRRELTRDAKPARLNA